MRAADYIIDVGPDAGSNGGEIVFNGYVSDLPDHESNTMSHTLRYLNGKETIEVPKSRRPWNLSIELIGARMNNLKGIDLKFPLNTLIAVTGVSGSGKSSLVKGILYPALKRRMSEACDMPGEFKKLAGDCCNDNKIFRTDQP